MRSLAFHLIFMYTHSSTAFIGFLDHELEPVWLNTHQYRPGDNNYRTVSSFTPYQFLSSSDIVRNLSLHCCLTYLAPPSNLPPPYSIPIKEIKVLKFTNTPNLLKRMC